MATKEQLHLFWGNFFTQFGITGTELVFAVCNCSGLSVILIGSKLQPNTLNPGGLMKPEKRHSGQQDVQAEQQTAELSKKSHLSQKQLTALLDFLPDPVLAVTIDRKVEYVNPAFERVFGWTLNEVNGKHIQFIPDHLMEQAKEGTRQLFKYRAVHDFETQRYTKDGLLLDILINGSIYYDEDKNPAGQVLILRDMTVEKRMAKSNQIMFRISKALHSYQKLGDLIDIIKKETQNLIPVEGAFILLADTQKDQLYFYSAKYRDKESEKKFKKIRFPADQGVSGRVYQTGEPMIIPDVTKCAFFLKRVDDETDLVTRNIISVPIKLKNRTIGVFALVNKHSGDFDNNDIELLGVVTSAIALPIENTRINEELRESYRELQKLNHAKDKVINHLAHELKTPVSVLDASMKLLSKKLAAQGIENELIDRIFTRGKRNLTKILDIQYEVEDLLRKKDFKAYNILNRLVNACKDELTVLVESETENLGIINRIHDTIDSLFGPKDVKSRKVDLDKYLVKQIDFLKPDFSHRKCIFKTKIEKVPPIQIPHEVLDIIIRGLIRNAVEYTPDGGTIDIVLKTRHKKPELIVSDHGIGFTKDKLHLIFEDYFCPPESIDYSTKTPYDFNAGGRGFDLLRMKLFSEQYQFKIWLDSKRCKFIPRDDDICPGDIKKCRDCTKPEDCFNSGGTSVHIRF